MSDPTDEKQDTIIIKGIGEITTAAPDNNDDASSSSSSSCYEDIGFLFEGSHETKHQTLTFTPEGDVVTGMIVTVELNAVDDHPGAVQSGHYLWPAAPALAQFLVNHFRTGSDDDDGIPCAGAVVVELGAGCGLAGLVAVQLRAACVVFTDHDPGTLERARENHANTLRTLDNDAVSSVPVFFERLKWGDDVTAAVLRGRRCHQHAGNDDDREETDDFVLVLGSDLIYCREVVRPLLRTVAGLLLSKNEDDKSSTNTHHHNPNIMVMSQSFPYDMETEQEIVEACQELSLLRSILSCELNERTGGVRIQTFSYGASQVPRIITNK